MQTPNGADCLTEGRKWPADQKEENRLRDEAQKRYAEAVDKIEHLYERDKKNITHAKKEAIKKMVKKVKILSGKLFLILK